MSLNLPSSASIEARDSDKFTRRSEGFGRKTSSISETTNIEDSAPPDCGTGGERDQAKVVGDNSNERGRTGSEKK